MWNLTLRLLVLTVKATLLKRQFFGPLHGKACLVGYRTDILDNRYGKVANYLSQSHQVTIRHVNKMSEMPKSAAARNKRNTG
jgi:hypothetical protein